MSYIEWKYTYHSYLVFCAPLRMVEESRQIEVWIVLAGLEVHWLSMVVPCDHHIRAPESTASLQGLRVGYIYYRMYFDLMSTP